MSDPHVLVRMATMAISACDAEEAAARGVAAMVGAGEPWILSVGKDAIAMATGAQTALAARRKGRRRRGLAVAKTWPTTFAPPSTAVLVGEHPLPGARSASAAAAVRRWVQRVPERDQLIVLLSGGTSSLIGAPAHPMMTQDDLERTAAYLLEHGLPIRDVNAIRRVTHRLGGGRGLEGYRGRPPCVFVLSDVLGVNHGDNDAIGVVGSGPFVPLGPAEVERARALVGAHRRHLPASVVSWVEGIPRPNAPPTTVPHQVLLSHDSLIAAAAKAAQGMGLTPRVWPSGDETVEATARALAAEGRSLRPGEVLVSGGEPTVDLPAHAGLGGRCQHLAALMSQLIAGTDLAFLALASDGDDGSTPGIAGGLVDGTSWKRLPASLGPPQRYLARFQSHDLLAAMGALVPRPRSTTNLLDLHVLYRPDPQS
ncbi:MAG: DUF4147 domain-containing protein [Myxococcota bacterium]